MSCRSMILSRAWENMQHIIIIKGILRLSSIYLAIWDVLETEVFSLRLVQTLLLTLLHKSNIVLWSSCLQQKCDQYWPSPGQLGIYGRLQVTPVCQDVQDYYTLRVLRLKLLRIQGDQLVDDQDCPERDVLHFHYTSWPDHGTPETAGQLLAFIQKSSQSSRDTDGPIVVHCRWVWMCCVSNSSIASIDCKTND